MLVFLSQKSESYVDVLPMYYTHTRALAVTCLRLLTTRMNGAGTDYDRTTKNRAHTHRVDYDHTTKGE